MGIKMNYDRDLQEVADSIREGIDIKDVQDSSVCVERMTMLTGEDYLDNRARYLKVQLENDNDLRKAFKVLAQICNKAETLCDECPVRKYCNKYILSCRKENSEGNLLVDLFCGAGGLSLGFTQEGFTVALANDIEDCCVETYAHNHPETPRDHIIKGDIGLLYTNLSNLLQDKQVDVIVGGPPCQGFSMANRQRLIDDPRNKLYRYYVEIVSKVKPKFFVMENVKGMLNVASQVKEDFEAIGYTVSYNILNAKDFGVPQNRERLIYIGNRVGISNTEIFKEIDELSKKIPYHTLEDALFGLRELKASRTKNSSNIGTPESGFIIERNCCLGSNNYIDYINQGKKVNLVYNHKARYNNDRDIEIFGRMNPGDRADDPKIADIMPYARRNGIFKDKYYKLQSDKICKTITAHMKYDCNMYIHPTQARGLTPREAARVQSYPDDYFFKGPYTKTYMQIGNSVPPLLGRAIASVIKQFCK